jgi:hypothetical protein
VAVEVGLEISSLASKFRNGGEQGFHLGFLSSERFLEFNKPGIISNGWLAG